MMKTERFAHYEYVGVVYSVSERGYGIKDPLIILVKSLLEDVCTQIEACVCPSRNVVKFITRSIENRDNVKNVVAKDFEINSVVCRLATALDGMVPLTPSDEPLIVSLKCSLLKLCFVLSI